MSNGEKRRKHGKDRNYKILKRILVLLVMFGVVVFLPIGWKLWDLQVIQHDTLEQEAIEQADMLFEGDVTSSQPVALHSSQNSRCSAGGSGDFAPAADLPLEEQIAQAKARIAPKFRGSRYIAYFQAYTNTYAPVERLKALFEPVIHRPDIAADRKSVV